MGWSLIIIRDNRAQCFKTQIPWTIKWLRRVRQYKAGKRTRAKERSGNIFVWFSLLAGWVYGLWFLCPGTSEGSTGSGSGFKLSQKTGPRLKVSSGRLGEAGNRTYDPWFTRHTPFCGFPGYKPVPPGWFNICVGFKTGTPRNESHYLSLLSFGNFNWGPVNVSTSFLGNTQKLTESGFMERWVRPQTL